MHMHMVERHWTVDDLHALPDDGNRYEVIDGELLVTPSPTLRHQDAVGALYVRLRGYLERERVGHAFVAPADVVFSPTRAVQPDLFVTPLDHGQPPERFENVKRLLLAIEVLSPSTARADRVTKRTLFRDEGVGEYWIVDLESRTVERSTPGDARVDVLADDISWMPHGAATPFVLDIPAYFRGLVGA